jgi:xanthine dehydrogenase YagS FAD-binding subunit
MPWRARVAEDALLGQPLTAQAVVAAVAREMEAATPLPDNGFKTGLTARITSELLMRLAGRGLEDPR